MRADLNADSAGFIGPGRSAAETTQQVARERGLDLSEHVSKVVTPDVVREHDLVVVMDPRQRAMLRRQVRPTVPVVALGDLDPIAPPTRAIPDPWGHDLEVFRASFERIDRCLVELLGAL